MENINMADAVNQISTYKTAVSEIAKTEAVMEYLEQGYIEEKDLRIDGKLIRKLEEIDDCADIESLGKYWNDFTSQEKVKKVIAKQIVYKDQKKAAWEYLWRYGIKIAPADRKEFFREYAEGNVSYQKSLVDFVLSYDEKHLYWDR